MAKKQINATRRITAQPHLHQRAREIQPYGTVTRARWPLTRRPYLLETSLPGIFAAGDVRGGNVKRVASAVGEGSIAISFVHQLLRE